MKHKILEHLLENKNLGKKSLAVLVDPDKSNRLGDLINVCEKSPPDIFLVGSSFQGDELIFQCVEKLRSISQVPIVLPVVSQYFSTYLLLQPHLPSSAMF